MKIKILIFLIILSFLYLLTTFFFSFIKISNYVGSSDHKMLSSFVITDELSKNLYSNSKKYIENNLQSFSKFLIIKDKNINLSGEFSEEFILSIFLKSFKSISMELSNPEIMLYFYDNSKELNLYFQKYLLNLGYYSFGDYILETKVNKDVEIIDNKNNNIKTENKNIIKESNKIKINRIFSKLNSTQFFFFISPIHFKLSVYHQDLLFSAIFKFQGYKWKINNIIFDFSSIIKVE
tara:strand:+ start:273 stop:980 length:708 start_codon:yes stop_codon:yes gene_type:complete